MLKISVNVDCGNSPKMQFIKDFCIANAKGDIPFVLEMVSEDIHLEIPGYKTAVGKEEVKKILTADAARSEVTEVILETVISHGKQGAANGTLIFADGGRVAFCTMYTFTSFGKEAKLQKIQTYSIVLSE